MRIVRGNPNRHSTLRGWRSRINLTRTLLASGLLALALWLPTPALASFTAFESGQVRPLALSADGRRLFAVNTPDNRLEIFAITESGLRAEASVPVGLEPVAVAARDGNAEVWVVNHLSDSISIVDVRANPPRVVRTLLVGDEPRDIVFAGRDRDRAFITTAHRGQNSPIDPRLTTAGIGRADVWVFDARDPGAGLGGTPLSILSLFTDTPRALAVSADGATVYAAGFHTGNRTTTISEGSVCDGGATARPCRPARGEVMAPGGLPAPNRTVGGDDQPEAGLIVKFRNGRWRDELNRAWDSQVRFNLPDQDVFAIDANAATPRLVRSHSGVGTVLFNMAVNPVSGKLYVSNTEAINEVRFEGERTPGDPTSTVLGRLQQARITVIDGTRVLPRHLNKHINYELRPAPASVRANSLAIPTSMAISSDGATLYLAAFGSAKIGVFSTALLENDRFVPDAASRIAVSGGGPSGLVLDEARGRLYVLTRFDNSIAVIDTATRRQTTRRTMHNPEPLSLVTGRPFLYDAALTSSNGEASCASCHVFGDLDSLAWDLGDPKGTVLNNPSPFTIGPIGNPDFHPMKGPMTTQSLRGMAAQGPMHWRGDRTGGNDERNRRPDRGIYNEQAAFRQFNPAFVSLLGRETPLTDAQMQAFTDFVLQLSYPPNPIRALDNSLTLEQELGRRIYFNVLVDTRTCNGCHTLDPEQGLFGGDGRSSFEGEKQQFKIPHLRNVYQKVGMFGNPGVAFIRPGDNAHQGDQVRGFGLLHDGSIDTMFRFFQARVFNFLLSDLLLGQGDEMRRRVEQFVFAFPSNLAPIVGQQITLDTGNAASVNRRIDLLLARAAQGECDVTVKGVVDGVTRGWFRTALGLFISDRTAEPPIGERPLRALAATPGQALTYTCVPPGSGLRIGVDRDEDGVRDGDEV
ncbi:MAG: YncE family protein [Panacagrimonas sp.]